MVEDLTRLNECNYKISAESLLWEGVFVCWCFGVFRSWKLHAFFVNNFGR